MTRARRIAGRTVRRRRRIGARLDLAMAGTGIVLLPWQRDLAIRLLDGEQLTLLRGRKAGWTTIERAVTRAWAQSAGGR